MPIYDDAQSSVKGFLPLSLSRGIYGYKTLRRGLLIAGGAVELACAEKSVEVEKFE